MKTLACLRCPAKQMRIPPVLVDMLPSLTGRTWLEWLGKSLFVSDTRPAAQGRDLSRLWLSQAKEPSDALRQLLRPQAALSLDRLYRLRPSLQALQRAGVPWILLKGAALAASEVYPIGARQMADIDILVPPGRFLESWTRLRELGWSSCQNVSIEQYTNFEFQEHSVDLIHPDQGNLDLHWSALNEGRRSGCDDVLWSRCRPANLVGMDCLVPCATDLLLTVCLHGYRRGGSSPRWTTDAAALLLLQGDRIVWDYLLTDAKARQMELPLLATLSWLDRQGAPVPSAVLDTLADQRVPFWQALDFWVRSGQSSRFKRATLVYLDYLRCCPGPHTPSFLEFLRLRWNW